MLVTRLAVLNTCESEAYLLVVFLPFGIEHIDDIQNVNLECIVLHVLIHRFDSQ